MTVQTGTRLGHFEIVEAIGAGGMGEVWRAKDTRLDREVAIKVLPPGFADDDQLRQRFEREAMAISQLNHPHVCTLYDVGNEESDEAAEPVHYLVMELLEGESLADRLQRGALPLEEVLRAGRQIASALDAAHRQGITHRDLKPASVMLTRSGAKLLDFGLAKTATEGQTPIDGLTNLPTQAKPLTQAGTILGTFQYMAPEQLEGLEADQAARGGAADDRSHRRKTHDPRLVRQSRRSGRKRSALDQIVVTLAMVGWLSRRRTTTEVAPGVGQFGSVK